jgi:replicative DNA helicase
MGKTGFVMGIVEHIASIGGLCQVFSIEMPRWQLTMRMACSRANASVHRGLNGWLSAEERANVLLAQDQLKKLPIWIDETHVSLLQIRAKGRLVSAKTKQRPSLLVVDYLQLMRAPRERNVSRDEQLSEITAGFKQLAKELDCAVVYLSQLNREVEKRQDKRPMLSDLRESGGIEQDADDVLFLYRPEYYLRTKTPPEDVGVAEVIVAKQRNGPDGIVRVAFDGPTVTFSDLENRPEEVQEANQ